MAESEEELKRLLMKVKEESEKTGLKLNIQKTKILASSPITLWQIDGETIETVTDFIFLDSRSLWMVTAAMKLRHFLLGRKARTNLDSILKSRDITLPTKVHSQSYGFSCSHVQMWELDNKKRLNTEELMPSNCGAGEDSGESLGLQGESNQSILKEINPEYSLEGVMLKLKLQYFGHLMWRASSLVKTLMLVKIEGRRRRRW